MHDLWFQYLMGSVMLADAIINTSALIKGTKMHISQENVWIFLLLFLIHFFKFFNSNFQIVSYLGLMFFCQLACSITAYNLTCNVADAMNEVTADMLQLYNFICFLFACMQVIIIYISLIYKCIYYYLLSSSPYSSRWCWPKP